MFAGGIGVQEIVIILIVGLLVFGAARLPKIAKSLGQGIKEFKKTVKGIDDDDDEDDSRNQVRYMPNQYGQGYAPYNQGQPNTAPNQYYGQGQPNTAPSQNYGSPGPGPAGQSWGGPQQQMNNPGYAQPPYGQQAPPRQGEPENPQGAQPQTPPNQTDEDRQGSA